MKELRLYDPSNYCEVTLRTDGGKFRFDLNDSDLRDLVYGVFAEAVDRYKVAVFAFHFMSNHYHGLYGFSSPAQFVAFLAFLHGNLARIGHHARNTSGKFWAPLKVCAVAPDAESVARRVRYILGQAVAAQLVEHPGQFPGPSSVDAMLYGKRLMGRRLDRTSQCRDRARLVGGAKPDEAYETWVELQLAVPHCWESLRAEELRHLYAAIAADIASSVPRQHPGQCLMPKIAEDSTGPMHGDEATGPTSPLEPEKELLPAPQPKQVLPTRESEEGGVYSQGPVQPKQVDGKRRRSRPPRLLAADQQLVDAYEERYKEAVTLYYDAKAAWLCKSRVCDGAVCSAEVGLPPWMLLGTLPLRLAGDSWAGWARLAPD